MKSDKEMLKKVEELKYSSEVEIENVLKSISTTIKRSIDRGNKKFEKFEKEFNIEFPEGTALRGASEAVTWALLNTALELYFIGNNSALFVELHGFLERFVLRELPKRLAKDEPSKNIISKIIERKTLSELSEFFVELNIWNEEDLKFAKKLSSIRNGIVHKNVKIVSKHFGAGNATATSQIYEIVSKVDCAPYILETIKLLIKLSGVVKNF